MAEDVLTELFLCNCEDVREGEPFRVILKPYPAFAVYHVEGGFYATDDTCSHGQASLGDEGDLDGFTIMCTWHDGAFDIRTGQAVASPCVKAIRAYPVTVRDGGIYISFTAPALVSSGVES
jgi:nitrite reductase/ring-hydroxylating ferredoxin subunit